MDTFDLYELCVTDGPRLARFLRAVHGRDPKVLREDFSGTGALSRAWAQQGGKQRAVAVDRDRTVLQRASGARVRTVAEDVMRCGIKADIIAATNFPIGYWHARHDLVAYLKHVRKCLNSKGVFICDTYGGRDAFTRLRLRRRVRSVGGTVVEHTWEQREADPITAMVNDVLSFRTRTRTGRARSFPDAFVYRWRLWSIPELRDAMHDAGFSRSEVYSRMGDAVDSEGNIYTSPVCEDELMDENYVVYIAARR